MLECRQVYEPPASPTVLDNAYLVVILIATAASALTSPRWKSLSFVELNLDAFTLFDQGNNGGIEPSLR
jgi:hypothetical protein